MKVKLINVAEYDIKAEKVSEVPFETMKNLCGYEETKKSDEALPSARLFKTIQEMKEALQESIEEYDTEMPVKLFKNGQIVVFLKAEEKEKTTKKEKKTESSTPSSSEKSNANVTTSSGVNVTTIAGDK